MSDRERELSLREMLERAWGAWPRIALIWLGTLALAAFVVLFWPRTYASTAQVFLQKGRESIGLDPTVSATGRTVALHQAGRDAEIKSAIDVLASRGVIEPVVDRLTPTVVLGQGPEKGPKHNPLGEAINHGISWLVNAVRSIDPASERERAVVEIEKHLQVSAERKSEVITISYEADTPQLAQQVVAAVVEEYRRKHADLYRTDGSTEFFDQQSRRLKEELDQKSDALRVAKNEMGLSSIEGQRTTLEQQMRDTRGDLLDVEKQSSAAQARWRSLTEELAARPARIPSAETTKPNSSADMQRQLLYDLQISLEEVRSKFQDSHPQVQFLQRQVASAKAELDKQVDQRTEFTDDVNPIHSALSLEIAQVEAEIAGLTASKQKLQDQETDLLAKIQQLNAFEVKIAQLEREVEVAEKKYMTYAESLEEARVDHAMQAGRISSVNVSQAATLQEKPVAPSKPLAVIAAGLLGLLGTIAIVLWSVQCDDRLKSEETIRKQLNVPVLGTLPGQKPFGQVSA